MEHCGTAWEQLERLNRKAVQNGYKLQTVNTDDLALLPTSFIVESETETIHLITHVPLFVPGSKKIFLWYNDAPITFLHQETIHLFN